jgi:hypothetical protein
MGKDRPKRQSPDKHRYNNPFDRIKRVLTDVRKESNRKRVRERPGRLLWSLRSRCRSQV